MLDETNIWAECCQCKKLVDEKAERVLIAYFEEYKSAKPWLPHKTHHFCSKSCMFEWANE